MSNAPDYDVNTRRLDPSGLSFGLAVRKCMCDCGECECSPPEESEDNDASAQR
jgi:hypothetical protein